MGTSLDTDNALLSLADAKEYLGSTATTVNDSKIYDIINAVSHRMNAETGRLLKSRSYTEYYDGNGKSDVLLRQWPISSTSITITIDSDRAFTSTDDVVTSTDVMLDTDMGWVRLDDETFSIGERNIKVEYSAGYTTAAAYDLTMAAKEMCKAMWNRMTGKQGVGVDNEAYEGVSRSYEQDIPWSVRKVLDNYRGPRGV